MPALWSDFARWARSHKTNDERKTCAPPNTGDLQALVRRLHRNLTQNKQSRRLHLVSSGIFFMAHTSKKFAVVRLKNALHPLNLSQSQSVQRFGPNAGHQTYSVLDNVQLEIASWAVPNEQHQSLDTLPTCSRPSQTCGITGASGHTSSR